MPSVKVILIIYLVFINILNIFLFGIDKSKAKHNSKRISEKSLFLVSFIGGVFGAILAMMLFRHKTRKTGFKLAIFLLILWNLILYGFIVDRVFYELYDGLDFLALCGI